MVSIVDAIGIEYSKVLLKDNESIDGGKCHDGETLGEFMDFFHIKPLDDYGELCVLLEQHGLKAIRPIQFVDQSGRARSGYDVYNLIEEW